MVIRFKNFINKFKKEKVNIDVKEIIEYNNRGIVIEGKYDDNILILKYLKDFGYDYKYRFYKLISNGYLLSIDLNINDSNIKIEKINNEYKLYKGNEYKVLDLEGIKNVLDKILVNDVLGIDLYDGININNKG